MLDLLGSAASIIPYLTGGAGLAGLASIGFSLLRFGFSPSKFLLLGAVAVIAAGAVYHFYTVSSLRGDMLKQAAENTVLKLDNETLKKSVESLDNTIKLQSEAAAQMVETLGELNAKDEATQKQLREALIKSEKAAKAVARGTRSGNARQSDRVINAVNRNLRCQLDNIGKRGKCVAGEWRPQ